MRTIGEKFPKLSILLIAALLFGSCQSDLVDVPQAPSSNSSDAKIMAPGAYEMRQTPEGSPTGFFTQLLGRVTRLITPLTGGILPLRTSRLEIPPLAVLSPLLVTWELRVETPPVGLTDPLSRVYEFWPNGYPFLRSITLRVSFADAGLGNRDPLQYRFYYYNEITRSWEPQPTVVDAGNQQFVVTLEHFSRYAFGR